jgi:hypothetical protein
MLWVGTLLAAAVAAAAYGAWWLLRVRKMPLGNWVGVLALGLWLVGLSIAWLVREPAASDESTQAIASLAWPGTTHAPVVRGPPASAGVQAPPVESLLTGLEARLAEQPNDAQGWTLLAQSYAYTSDAEATERAVRRAVELGVDEAVLRERIASAQRRAQPVDWVEETLRAGRPR